MRRWSAALLFLGMLVASVPAQAQLPESMAFWELVAQSDRIVVARVEQIVFAKELTEEDMANPDFIDFEDEIRLLVRETWKGAPAERFSIRFPVFLTDDGSLRTDSLVVAFLRSGETLVRDSAEQEQMDHAAWEGSAVCPAVDYPQQWEGEGAEGNELGEPWNEDTVEAWRQRWIRASVGRWFPTDFPLGVMSIREEDAAVFRSFVREALALKAGEPVRQGPLRDWGARAASRRATRLHALSAFPRPASQDELIRIAQGFTREPSEGQSFLETLRLVEGFENSDFDLAAISVVEAALEKDPPGDWTVDVAALVLQRFGDTGAAERLRAAAGSQCAPTPPGSLQNAWAESLVRLGIPMVSPARIQ